MPHISVGAWVYHLDSAYLSATLTNKQQYPSNLPTSSYLKISTVINSCWYYRSSCTITFLPQPFWITLKSFLYCAQASKNSSVALKRWWLAKTSSHQLTPFTKCYNSNNLYHRPVLTLVFYYSIIHFTVNCTHVHQWSLTGPTVV